MAAAAGPRGLKPNARSTSGRGASALLWLFVAVTLLAPAAPLNKALFVLLFAWTLKDMLWGSPKLTPLLPAPMLLLAVFAYGWALSWLHRTDAALAMQFFMSAFVPFLIHFVRRHTIDVDWIVESTALAMLGATAIYWIAVFMPDLPHAGTVRALIETYGLGALAEREFVEDTLTLSLHLGTVPFLFIAFCLRCGRCVDSFRLRDGLLLLVLGGGIAISASRGLLAISVFFLVAMLFGRVPPLARLLAASVAALAFWLVVEVYLSNTLVLSAEEISNAAKIGHFESYFDDLTWGSALAGRGLANYYFSTGANAYVAHTEITPLDMARYVGVPLAALLYLMILFPTTRLKCYRDANLRWVAAISLYLLLSATNPVLFNSYGMLVVLWYWSKVLGIGFSVPDAATAATSRRLASRMVTS